MALANHRLLIKTAILAILIILSTMLVGGCGGGNHSNNSSSSSEMPLTSDIEAVLAALPNTALYDSTTSLTPIVLNGSGQNITLLDGSSTGFMRWIY